MTIGQMGLSDGHKPETPVSPQTSCLSLETSLRLNNALFYYKTIIFLIMEILSILDNNLANLNYNLYLKLFYVFLFNNQRSLVIFID